METKTDFFQKVVRNLLHDGLYTQIESPDYRDWEKRHEHAYQLLEEALGGKSELFFQLDELENEQLSMMNEVSYKQGYMDCIALLKSLGLL